MDINVWIEWLKYKHKRGRTQIWHTIRYVWMHASECRHAIWKHNNQPSSHRFAAHTHCIILPRCVATQMPTCFPPTRTTSHTLHARQNSPSPLTIVVRKLVNTRSLAKATSHWTDSTPVRPSGHSPTCRGMNLQWETAECPPRASRRWPIARCTPPACH